MGGGAESGVGGGGGGGGLRVMGTIRDLFVKNVLGQTSTLFGSLSRNSFKY